jgi:tRNA threonylcarbamoyladenosine biosynthesis protein TsaB
VLVLAVHTTSLSLGVAVTKAETLLGQVILPPGKEHLENLVPSIRDLTEGLGISLRELDALAVATGPGSFSGIRIGIACVKGIGIALNKPVIGISSLEIPAWNVLSDGQTGISVIDARRNEIYVGGYKKQGRLIEETMPPRLIRTADLSSMMKEMPEETVLIGDAALQSLFPSIHDIKHEMVTSLPVSTCGFIAFERLRRGASSELDTLTPVYIRRSDAEEKRALLKRSLN